MDTRKVQTLPPELWSQVIDYVPQVILQDLLTVCSLFRELILRRLFSSIKLYLIGGEAGMRMLNTFDLDRTHETTVTKMMRKSWEMLNRISKDPLFARLVKSITIIAYAEVTLVDTLSALPNLHTFSWVGCQPDLDDEIAQCIPATVRSLDIRASMPVQSMHHLTQITSLNLPVPFLFPEDREVIDGLVEDIFLTDICTNFSIEKVFDVFPSTLQSLRVCASHIINIPVRLYSTLRELTIFGTIGDEREFMGLGITFRHAACLESLDIVGHIHPVIFTFIPHESSNDMPKLTSFRLSIEALFPMTDEQVYVLTGFLKNRPSLRRLYFRHREMQFQQTSYLLQTVAKLEALEVLGLHTGCDAIATKDPLRTISEALSPNLRALHLSINWIGDFNDHRVLLDRIADLPKLTFLHLYGIVVRFTISIGDLAMETKNLDTIGLNRSLWSVARAGPEIVTYKWPRWKIKYCVEEDFSTPDDYWLFKYN